MSDPGDKLPFGRRRRTAASALVVILIAFGIGVLFNAPAMKKTALELPFGGARSFRLALVAPAAAVSHWLFLDRPARYAASLLGKPDPGPEAVQVVVVPTPTPEPSATKKSDKGDKGDKGQKDGGKPAAERPLPKPYAGHPMHLYIAGDSMAGIPGMALVNMAKDTKLIKPLLDYHISTGLVRPDFFNWPLQLQQQAKAFDPGAAVVMWGANDNQGVETSSGKIHQFGTDGWKKEYRKRVEDVIAILSAEGVRRIYWVGQPVMPDASYDRQIRLMNDIFESVAADHPGVEYIDAYSLFSSGGGGYSQYLKDDKGETQQVREADGEHLTYAGGQRLAKAVMEAIKADWLTKTKKDGGSGASASPSAKASPKPGATPSP